MAFLWDLAAEFVDDARELWTEGTLDDDAPDEDTAEDASPLVPLSARSVSESGGWASARDVPAASDRLHADLRDAARALHARGEGLARLDATVDAHAHESARLRGQAAELRAWSDAHASRGCLACF